MKTFDLYGQSFTVSDDFEKYNTYRQIFNEATKMIADDFKNTYMEQITNLDMLITRIPKYAMELIKNITDKTIEMLVNENIMNIDSDTFIKKYYYEYFNFEKYYDPILEKYTEITEASESLNEYRKMQKMTRSKWQGGGFGISGAVKGAVTAGVLNIGTDFLRSFGDSSQTKKDKNQIDKMKRDVFNDRNTFLNLYKGIYNCVFGVFYGLIDQLILNNVIKPIHIDSKESNIIYQNVLKYVRDPEMIITNIIKCLTLNPYNFQAYEILISTEIDGTEDIIQMANYFGFKKEINDILKEKYKKEINLTIDLPETNADEIISKIFKYENLTTSTHIDYSKTIISLVSKLVYIIDSKKELELIYSKIKENLSLNYSSSLFDIDDIFNEKLNKYNNKNKGSEKENLEKNTTYKTIYDNANYSNDFRFLKKINSEPLFAFSLNGEKFAYMRDYFRIFVYDTKTKALSNVLIGEEMLGKTEFITFGRDIRYIFSVNYWGEIFKWDLNLLKITNKYKSKLNKIASVVYCKDKNSIILCGKREDTNKNMEIEVFDITKNKIVKMYDTNSNLVGDLSCSFNGKYVSYAYGYDYSLCLLNINTWQVDTLLKDIDKIYLLKFSPTSNLMAYEYSEGKITVWDYLKDKSKCHLDCGDVSITNMEFSPNNKLLAVSFEDNIQIWDLNVKMKKVTLSGYNSGYSSVIEHFEFSPDGNLLVTSDYVEEDDDNKLIIWSINDSISTCNNSGCTLDETDLDKINLLLNDNKKIEAIRKVMKETGMTLKEAKNFINEYENSKYWGKNKECHNKADDDGNKDAKNRLKKVEVKVQKIEKGNKKFNPKNDITPIKDEESLKKSRMTAGLLAIFLGGLGLHKFYLRKYLIGIIYLIFCWTLIPSIISIIEGIYYLTMNNEKFEQKYSVKKSTIKR